MEPRPELAIGGPCLPNRIIEEYTYGHQESWLATFREGPVRVVHWHGTDRSAFQAPDPALVQGASVTFEPGARTPGISIPSARRSSSQPGCGWAQREDGPIEEIRPGDVVWFPPGEKHWHGATPTSAMTHIAIQEQLDGKVVDWMEHVSDQQYRK